GAGERGQRARVVGFAQAVAAELLVGLGIVRRELQRLCQGVLGVLGAAVLREQFGSAQPGEEAARLERERLTVELQGGVEVAAVEQQRDQLAARLGVVEPEAQRLAQLYDRFLRAAEPPQRAGSGAMGASQLRVSLGGLGAGERGARSETDRVESASLGDQRIGEVRRGGARLLRQLQRRPAFAAIEPVAGERVEQRRVLRVLRERGL